MFQKWMNERPAPSLSLIRAARQRRTAPQPSLKPLVTRRSVKQPCYSYTISCIYHENMNEWLTPFFSPDVPRVESLAAPGPLWPAPPWRDRAKYLKKFSRLNLTCFYSALHCSVVITFINVPKITPVIFALCMFRCHIINDKEKENKNAFISKQQNMYSEKFH